MKYFLIVLFALMQFGCANNPKITANDAVKPLIVFDRKEDGWGGDIRLSLVNITENDSSRIYKAVSQDNGQNLGILIYVTKKKTNSQGFGNAITLKSIGKESDNLLHKLASLYKQKIVPAAKFADTVSASFVDLKKFSISVAGSAGEGDVNTDEYKLFIETKNDEAEFFLNINATDKWVELREKDEEYRPLVIQVLSK
jgi:hypothetical protein